MFNNSIIPPASVSGSVVHQDSKNRNGKLAIPSGNREKKTNFEDYRKK